MSDVPQAVIAIVKTGVEPTYTGSLSVSDVYQFVNDGKTFIHVKNGGGSPDLVTIVSQISEDGLAVADRTVNVPAGEERMIGPLLPHVYNDGDGLVNVSHSFITSVTQAVFSL